MEKKDSKNKSIFSCIKNVKNNKTLIQILEANISNINERDEKKRTALILLCMNKEDKKENNSKIRAFLSFKECDLNIRDELGYSALMYACRVSNNKTIKMLLDTGRCDPNLSCTSKRTPLMLCCLMRNKIGAQMIIETGECDINQVDSAGNTAFILACGELELEIMESLIKTGKCDINAENKIGYTALHTISTNYSNPKELYIFRLLLSCENLDLNVRGESKSSILDILVTLCHDENNVQKALLVIDDKRCKLNCTDDFGSTTLMHAVNSVHKNYRIIHALLSTERCNINIQDKNGQTALHRLYRNLLDENDIEILELFLKNPRCDQELKDVWGFKARECINISMKDKIFQMKPKNFLQKNQQKEIKETEDIVLTFEIFDDKVSSSFKKGKISSSFTKPLKQINGNKREFDRFEKKIMKASFTKNEYEHKEFDSTETPKIDENKTISFDINIKELEDLKSKNQIYVKNLKEIEAVQKTLNDRMSLLEEQSNINLKIIQEQQTVIERLKTLNVDEFVRNCSKPSDFELIQERAKNFHSKLIQSTIQSYKNTMKITQEQMQQQVDELHNETLCVICIEEKKSCLIQPCNHACICQKCSKDLKQCPISSLMIVVNATHNAFSKEARELFKKHKQRLSKEQLAELDETPFEEGTKWMYTFISKKIENGDYKFWMPIGFSKENAFSKTQVFYVRFRLMDEFPDFSIVLEPTGTFDAYMVTINKKNPKN